MNKYNLLAAYDIPGDGDPPPDSGKITNPVLSPFLQSKTGVTFFQDLLPRIIGFAFIIGVLVFFFVFIMGAIQWISSSGDKAGIEQARGKLINALVGLVLLFITFAIIKIVESFFGINILLINLGPLIIS